ncbi:MAG: hypothetical protein GC202_02115 [Alphaproteobacteria bacterium]|nr:hypothetical protein [Alphaproteobacteria bacterium]
MGRRALPAAVHALNGNPGKRKRKPDNAGLPPGDPQVVDRSVVELPVPKPIAGMSVAARRHWTRLAPVLVKRGLLRETDLDSFATLCRLEAEDEKLAKIVESAGRYYTNNGVVRRHPAVSDRQRITKDLRDYRDRFGLNPQARVRVPTGIPDAPRLPFDQLQPGATSPKEHGQDHDNPAGNGGGNPLDAFIGEHGPRLPN